MAVFSPRNDNWQIGLLLASVFALAMPAQTQAQKEPARARQPSNQRAEPSASAGQSLADQIRQLQAKVAKLETALKQKHRPETSKASGSMGRKMSNKSTGSNTATGSMQGMGMKGRSRMGGKGSSMGMGMMSKKGSMSEKEMPEKDKMGGMKMMGRMKGMAGTKTPEPLPAFPDAPGIYHVGATGFYLDQGDKLILTPEQNTAVKKIRDNSMSEQAAFDEQIGGAEEDLGKLTGSDQPDAAKIDAQIRKIERLRADQRMAFIRSVGRAAAALTDQQRKTLTAQPPGVKEAPKGKSPEPTKAQP